jgi:hypothetical protein
VHDDDCVVVLRCDGEDELITVMPRSQIIPLSLPNAITWGFKRATTCKETHLSPIFPSTVIYPSPESDWRKTIAADLPRATLPAVTRSKSSNDHDNVVRVFLARDWRASKG